MNEWFKMCNLYPACSPLYIIFTHFRLYTSRTSGTPGASEDFFKDQEGPLTQEGAFVNLFRVVETYLAKVRGGGCCHQPPEPPPAMEWDIPDYKFPRMIRQEGRIERVETIRTNF